MHAHTGRLEVSPTLIDDVIDADRESGAIVGISFWESQADLEAAEELGEQSRSVAAEAGQAGVAPVTAR